MIFSLWATQTSNLISSPGEGNNIFFPPLVEKKKKIEKESLMLAGDTGL